MLQSSWAKRNAGVSHDQGNRDERRSDAKSGQPAPLNDTQPGLPDIELARTLPMGPALSGTGGPLSFGTTRREFAGVGDAPREPKLSAREKAKRNILTHTLQMPLVVNPAPPSAASEPPARARQATTQKGGSPSPLPAGWTSVHRVGSMPNEAEQERPAPRHTDPMLHNRQHESVQTAPTVVTSRYTHEPSREREPAETARSQSPVSSAPIGSPSSDSEAASFDWRRPPPLPQSARRSEDPHRESERDTHPSGVPIRVPALNTREWLFIGLLACASAATLYSLLIDDTTRSTEDDTEAATSPEHVVTPAPLGQEAERGANLGPNLPGSAAPAEATAIISDPAQAEIVLGGDVIGTTPAQVARGTQGADYLVRKAGYEPQLVRVTPNSPKSITITLHPK